MGDLVSDEKKMIIAFLKFMQLYDPLMDVMIDEFLQEVYDPSEEVEV